MKLFKNDSTIFVEHIMKKMAQSQILWDKGFLT